MDSIEKLNYNKILKKEVFYSTLNHKHITDKEYKHYLNVWNKLKNKTLKSYAELYITQDGLFLADINENF